MNGPVLQQRLTDLADVPPQRNQPPIHLVVSGLPGEAPPERCLHQLFEAQAQRTPHAPALACGDERLTYRELDARARLLAQHLSTLDVRPDQPVGLLVERSLDMVVGVLGILKTGAAYLPIDPAQPDERIAFMLEDSGARLVLAQRALLGRLPDAAVQVVCLDTFDWTQPGQIMLAERLPAPESLAYVIYTSGSTGRPKGVCVEHRNIVSYVRAICERMRFAPGMQHATVSTIAADLGNTVLFPALATGGCLHVIAQDLSENGGRLGAYFARERIDVLKIVPSHLAALQDGGDPAQVMPRERLILGGEASRTDWIARLRALAPECEIHNHYGPTETTVGVLTYRVEGNLPATPSGTLPLGRALPNSHVYILDAYGQPAPAGVAGELCIGGQGVARGYRNRPERTQETFVADPFTDMPNARMYKSGDRARCLDDGTIEFCGRADRQIKLHGYRVEVDEIEVALRTVPGVADAAVQAPADAGGARHVVGYVVPRRADQPLWDFPSVYLLPAGAPVAHLNRNETNYIHHEIFELQAYLRHGIGIRDGDCIVDVGANIGLFTVFASRIARHLRIVAFEPNPAAFACLEANAAAWGSGVRCLPLGVSDQDGQLDLTTFEGLSLLSGFHADAATERATVERYVANQAAMAGSAHDVGKRNAPAGAASAPAGAPGAPDRAAAALDSDAFTGDLGELIDAKLRATTHKVEVRTLSRVIAEERIERIDLLKVNVEKSELEVLRGIAAHDWPKIRQLVIEVDRDANVAPITALLDAHGFDTLVEQDALLERTELCYVYAIRRGDARRLTAAEPAAAERPWVDWDAGVLTPAVLRHALRESLPQYMLPAAFVRLERMPLTPNGKVDRQALEAQAPVAAPAHLVAVAPQTATEATLAAIWAELLDAGTVGVDDNFFEIGGHSLLAIRIVSRLREAFGVDLALRDLFERPTVRGLAGIVDELKWVTQDAAPADVAPAGGAGEREEIAL